MTTALLAAARAPYLGLRKPWRAWLRWRQQRRLAGYRLLRAFADAYPEAFFIQIGANDGVQDDQLRPFVATTAWSGIMVEPLPSAFARLTRYYADRRDRVVLENAAIADRDGRVAVHHPAWVDGEEVMHHFDVLGSLSRDTVERTGQVLVPPLHQVSILSTDVPAMRFGSLCHKHAVARVDLLMIDAEGYDYEIVKQIDFHAYHHRLLVYEHRLLSPRHRDDCRSFVEGHGYDTLEERGDTWCLDTSRDDRLTGAWRRLRPAHAAESLFGGAPHTTPTASQVRSRPRPD